jgi:hypothetical protein
MYVNTKFLTPNFKLNVTSFPFSIPYETIKHPQSAQSTYFQCRYRVWIGCVVFIIFLIHSCLYLIFQWNSGPNVVSSIVAKEQICLKSGLAVLAGEGARHYMLYFQLGFAQSWYDVEKSALDFYIYIYLYRLFFMGLNVTYNYHYIKCFSHNYTVVITRNKYKINTKWCCCLPYYPNERWPCMKDAPDPSQYSYYSHCHCPGLYVSVYMLNILGLNNFQI